MLKVGITGGIGSGKSYVCALFKNLGIPLFEADSQMKELYQSNVQLQQELINAFGMEVYLTTGEINIPYLREILKNPQKREQLNQIAHPYVFQRFIDWSLHQKAPYVLKEAAILFESGANKTVDKTIGVFAPLNQRIERVKRRDGRSEEEIQKIIKMQLSEEELKSKVDFVIQNDDRSDLENQVLKLHQNLIDISAHFTR